MTPTPEGVNEVLEAIREVCDLKRDICPFYCDGVCVHDFRPEPHLEHVLQAIPNFVERWGNDDELFELFGGYRRSFDFKKTVEQNLLDNPELTSWLHSLLVTPKTQSNP